MDNDQVKLNNLYKIFLKFKLCCVMTLTLSLLLPVGCATTPARTIQVMYQSGSEPPAVWPDNGMEKRFSEYWFNRFSGRVEDNYAAEYPYFQDRISLSQYRAYVQHAAKNRLLKMEIQKIRNVSDYLVTVDCLATIQIDNEQNQVSLVDRWVLVDGKWYHVIKDPLFQI